MEMNARQMLIAIVELAINVNVIPVMWFLVHFVQVRDINL
jgi:hypothetical protein